MVFIVSLYVYYFMEGDLSFLFVGFDCFLYYLYNMELLYRVVLIIILVIILLVISFCIVVIVWFWFWKLKIFFYMVMYYLVYFFVCLMYESIFIYI